MELWKCADSEPVTQSIITDMLAAALFTSTFTDAILLDSNYKIVSISKELAQLFGCNGLRLEGESITVLSNEEDTQSRLRELIKPGFFKEHLFEFRIAKEKTIPVGVTGFCLGLISDLMQFTVLRIRSLEEIQSLSQSLTQKAEQIENFIYRSSHDLCGPVATIKGLINLARRRQDDTDVNLLFDYISQHTEVLNTRLRELERWASFYDPKVFRAR